ncbi:hypothetical protein SAMN06272721_11624 [Arthrobacter sp. P2b]|nr:hypothetical protein SAMN06272721_11624 [Arthrobacter sp. P2b]
MAWSPHLLLSHDLLLLESLVPVLVIEPFGLGLDAFEAPTSLDCRLSGS